MNPQIKQTLLIKYVCKLLVCGCKGTTKFADVQILSGKSFKSFKSFKDCGVYRCFFLLYYSFLWGIHRIFMEYSWSIHGVYVCVGYVSGMYRKKRGANGFFDRVSWIK